MQRLRLLVCLAFSTFVVAACSSSSDTSDPCDDAAQVVNTCNEKQNPDSGSTVTVTFDKSKCDQAGDQGKKIAQCISSNKGNCDCILKCSLSGSC